MKVIAGHNLSLQKCHVIQCKFERYQTFPLRTWRIVLDLVDQNVTLMFLYSTDQDMGLFPNLLVTNCACHKLCFELLI